MLKRTLIALTFVTAICAAGFGVTSVAEAGHGCGYGYRSHYYPSYYSYYDDGYDYGSRISYYRALERRHRHYDYYPHHHHHHHGSGVHFSIGF